MTEKPYLFEADTRQEAGYRRRREDALGEAETFLTRVGCVGEAGGSLPAPEGFRSSKDWELLLQFVMEVQLNIRWYEEHLDRHTRWDRAWRTIAILVGAVGLAGLPLLVVFVDLPIAERLASGSLNLLITQFGVLFTGFMAWLKVLASALDESDRQLAFWEASADLKEQLYTFERQWRYSPIYGEAALSDDFRDSLLEQIAGARQIVRVERRTFFESQKSPLGLLEALSGGGQEVALAGAEVAMARMELPREDPFAELLRTRREARAAYEAAQREVEALEYRVQVLEAASELPDRALMLSETLAALVDARVEVQRTRMSLAALAGPPR